ncbi:MAG: N-acyl amino acid synthase FeeM domain-containing protein [Bradyrhizobium sp.]
MRSPAEARPMAFGRSPDPLDQVDYRLAHTPAEKEEIYRLRYRAYLREGAIQPSSEGRVIDKYEDAPNAWTFGVYFHGELYSSIRVSVLTSEWRMSPSVELFGDVLHPELDKGRIFIDSTRFVADPDKARNFPELPYATVRLGSMAGVHFNADYGLAIVRPEHQAFYRRVFLQETWCEPRLYPGLVKPVGLMAAHLPTVRDRVLVRYPFLRSSAFERRMLFERSGERNVASDAVVTSFEPASIVPNT